jgi:hypothetical protein
MKRSSNYSDASYTSHTDQNKHAICHVFSVNVVSLVIIVFQRHLLLNHFILQEKQNENMKSNDRILLVMEE